MAKKRPTEPAPPTKLAVTKQQATEQISARIEKGREIRQLPLNSYEELEHARTIHSKWSKYNSELLTRLFTTKEIANEYSWSTGSVSFYEPEFYEEVEQLSSTLRSEIESLESIIERLDLIPEVDIQPA